MMNAQLCPICGYPHSREASSVYQGKKLEICDNCGVQYWFPIEHAGEHFYETSDTYSVVKRPLSWYHRQFFKGVPLKKGRLLDIGCGQGEFLVAAIEKGFEAWGIDIAPRNVDFIKKERGLQNVICGKIEDNIEQLGLFDIVTMFEVIEHVDSPSALLLSIKKILKPGGYIVVSTPNRKRLGSLRETWDFPPNHLFRWDANALSNLLQRSGYKVQKVKEQVIGRDALIMSAIMSFGVMRSFKAQTRKKQLGLSKNSSFVIKQEGISSAIFKKIANAKNEIFLIISSPFIFLGKILRLKYWDLYATARYEP